MNQLGSTFAALAETTRLGVVQALLGRDLCAGELAAKCSVSGPALSRHLRVLRRSGLIEVVHTSDAEQDARLRVYRLRPEQFLALRDWVDHMETHWKGQLRAFKSYAERKPRAKGAKP